MSRRSTRSTSGILPQKVVAEESLSPPATTGISNGSLKRKESPATEDFVEESRRPQRTEKRLKKIDTGLSKSGAGVQNGSGDVSAGDSHTQESSFSATKKVVASRTKGSETSATAARETAVVEATGKRVSKTEKTAGNVKEENEQEEIAVRKQKPTKGKKGKDKVSEEMPPLAARTTGLKMFVGAHVSAAQGIHNAVTNSMHIGGNAFALFLKSQRKWNNPPLQDDHRDEFRRLCVEHKYDASKFVLPHGSYLVNLAQADPVKAKQAYDSFVDDLKRCEEVGIKLYNFHPGATNNTTLSSSLSRIATALVSSLSATKTVIPVLENTCGHGTTIGSTISEFRSLLDLIPLEHHPRIGICLDTCHTFAAGYDLRSPESFKEFMDEFDREIGISYLKALHLNDSKAPLGSKRDLHANIGTGFLGLRAFHNVMNEPRLEGMPMILETPIDRVVDNDDDDPKSKKAASKSKKPSSKPKTVEDKSIWAREIKLLESLIGMDAEGEVFKGLERKLADEGQDEREKQMEVYVRKKKEREEAERKKSLKGKKGKGAVKGKGKKKDESESPLSSPPSSPS